MLPKQFLPRKCSSLIRVGSENDGGYVVDQRSLAEASVLISFGVNDNWDFESESSSSFNLRVKAYDFSVGPVLWIKTALRPLLKGLNVLGAISGLLKPLYFRRFFRNPHEFHKRKIGDGSNNTLSLTEIVENSSGTLFLKMDIEGYEYRVLPEILKLQRNFSGLAIEFHDLDLHRSRVEDFIEQLDMALVSLHANNTGGCDSRGDPLVVEMSFSRCLPKDGERSYDLNALQAANEPALRDIKLNISHDE